ncbi:hypothetical protein R1Y13_11030 [Pseudomonas sp. NY8938]|uniref:hypothetical protein n=1 Tax=Pseudomonas sp. NY8938 TaxID=3081664 RepID=UPI0038572F19
MSDREIALEQALIGVLGAAHELGYPVEALGQKANLLLIDHSKYRQVDHPHNTRACDEITRALELVAGSKPA